MNNSALILGASGLVGNFCLNILLDSPDYTQVTIIVRKALDNSHEKLKQVICTDFSKLSELTSEFKVDHVFCCIGTTIKTAGSKAAFSAIDLDIPVLAAQLSALQGARHFAVVSAAGANAESRNFYLRTKGLMEEGVKQTALHTIHIFRPGLILGERKEYRGPEKTAQSIMPFIDKFLFGKYKEYRSFAASDIAQSMVNAAKKEETGVKIFTFEEMKKELN